MDIKSGKASSRKLIIFRKGWRIERIVRPRFSVMGIGYRMNLENAELKKIPPGQKPRELPWRYGLF